ncbi:hypothetical protein [Halobacteriovorax sp.]|uniref:hypothetical protein n=1 Tax=Halobacteriovorax sp. TaxID=2020862 RepID=UPI00356AD12F
MKKPIRNTLMALSMFSLTFGAVEVYKNMNPTNTRYVASLESPILAEVASAKYIQEQKVKMEEVTHEMKNANGDMIKVTKKLVEIETKLAAQMQKGIGYGNVAKITELKNSLSRVKREKSEVEEKMKKFQVEHKKAIDNLTNINNRLGKEVLKAEDAKKELSKQIAKLEDSGKSNSSEIKKLRSNLEDKNKKSKDLNTALKDLSAQIDAKNIALAESVSANDKLNESIGGLNITIEMLNDNLIEKDQRIVELDTSLLSLEQDHSDLSLAKEELDKRMLEISLISEMQEEQISMKEEAISQRDAQIEEKNEFILEKDNTISCQQEEIKVNTDKITELQALINDSTKAIRESKEAMKELKKEKEERVERIAKLEKENKAFQKEKTEFDSVIQMMMANFMRLPQMFASMMSQSQGQMSYSPNILTNPLTGYAQQMQLQQAQLTFPGTGMKMTDPYAAPQYVTNNYYQQTTPYSGLNNDFSVRDMMNPESSRDPSGYFTF